MSKHLHKTSSFLVVTPERPAWGVLAQRGSGMLGDARDGDMREDLLCALLLGLYPTGPSG